VQEAWQHPSGRYFYVASSDQRTSTRSVRHHYVNAFHIESSGTLRPLGGAVQLAQRPIYITVDHRGEYLISAFSAPSGISVRRLNLDGSIGDEIEQEASFDVGFYAHAVRVMPSNRAVLLVTRGNEPVPGMRTEDPGALYLYRFENGQLTSKQSVAPNQGIAYRVRHADFHPSRRWVYVDLEAQNQLHTYSIQADDTLSREPLFVSTTLASPSTSSGGQTTSSIQMHPTNGRTLYVANRGQGTEVFQGERVANGTENTIAVFSIDPQTGEPTLIQTIETHSIAVRTMALSPDGRTLIAANTLPGKILRQGRVETVPAALTLYDIEDDGKLTFLSKLDVDTFGETMFWCGVVEY
jgi:6-phosphogluconolactonase